MKQVNAAREFCCDKIEVFDFSYSANDFVDACLNASIKKII